MLPSAAAVFRVAVQGWPLHRQWLSLSRIGGWLARPLCDVGDAPSGFFAFAVS